MSTEDKEETRPVSEEDIDSSQHGPPIQVGESQVNTKEESCEEDMNSSRDGPLIQVGESQVNIKVNSSQGDPQFQLGNPK